MRHRILTLLALVLALPAFGCATPQAATRPAAPAPKPQAEAAPPKPVVPPLPAPPTPGRLPQAATPTGYVIRLHVDPRQPRFQGDVTVHLDLHQYATELPFQAEHLHFTKVEAIAGGKHYQVTLKDGDWPGADPKHGDRLAVVGRRSPRGRSTSTSSTTPPSTRASRASTGPRTTAGGTPTPSSRSPTPASASRGWTSRPSRRRSSSPSPSPPG